MSGKWTVRFFLAMIAVLIFAFFSNDFNLVNVQKTALITALAIDKNGDEFSLTAIVANPAAQGDNGGNTSEKNGTSGGGNGYSTVEGKGGTVAEALEDVNAKTGWYPKLVFCRLLVLGESFCAGNVFDGLDYFLRNEYAAKDTLLAAADGQAKEILTAKPPVGGAVSEALEKVLADQPKQVGAVLTANLREFAISYFSAGKSDYIPLVSTQKGENGDLFQASETALFKDGKRIGKLTKEETFALACVKNPLRLASYTVEEKGVEKTLLIKNNRRKIQFSVDGDTPKLKVELTVYADLADKAESSPPSDLAMREQNTAVFTAAATSLKEQIEGAFATCTSIGFDAFDAIGKLQKYENNHFDEFKDSLIERLEFSVSVRFRSIR